MTSGHWGLQVPTTAYRALGDNFFLRRMGLSDMRFHRNITLRRRPMRQFALRHLDMSQP
ncbi:hypothetical protein AB7828_05130 [Tardiphaga sp. 215_C5_N2_1]|uniref:hypothetical protein n=1 Tax=Tardiphaga sp. 215_C5_N2_1 TaxID=3240774 RepID=UPI003F8C8CE4